MTDQERYESVLTPELKQKLTEIISARADLGNQLLTNLAFSPTTTNTVTGRITAYEPQPHQLPKRSFTFTADTMMLTSLIDSAVVTVGGRTYPPTTPTPEPREESRSGYWIEVRTSSNHSWSKLRPVDPGLPHGMQIAEARREWRQTFSDADARVRYHSR